METFRIALVGNPNCGKTTLFNGLTGSKQQVGNWPGVTVERKSGFFRWNDHQVEVVDLPGVYSLSAAPQSSADEFVARDYVLSHDARFIVNIVDASNLERNLYLTTQLLELGIPVLVALNMTDVAAAQGLAVDSAALSHALGCPVVEVVATKKKGLDALKEAIVAQQAANSGQSLPLPPEIVTALQELTTQIAKIKLPQPLPPEWLAMKLLEHDYHAETLCAALSPQVEIIMRRIEEQCGLEADILIADARYRFASKVAETSRNVIGEVSRGITDRIDRIVLNRFLGVPVFLGVMYFMFLFTINVGSAFIDFFDQSMGALLVDGLADLLKGWNAPDWLVVMLSNGVGGGIQTTATFIPVIGCLYLFLSALEDSGYMARAAFVMDRAMRAIGLPGKSFVPLIVGFGCNIPAIMAARTLENRRDRIMTIMMAPFMSCGARLPVYALFAAAFFPTNGQNIVFLLYLIGIAFAVLTGLLLKTTLLKGQASPFVMELPLYHIPTLGTVGRRAWDRLRDFVFRAGRVIVPMVVVLSVLNSMSPDGSFGNEDSDKSVLANIGKSITPAFKPMGLKEENWQAAVGLFTGIMAKEAVVGTLNSLYSTEKKEAAEDDKPTTLGSKLLGALQTIPDNFAQLGDSLLDPLGLNVSYTENAEDTAKELSTSDTVFRSMQERFDGAAGAFAFLLVILLYTPCVAANGAIRTEIGGRWMSAAAIWTFFVGYVAAVIFYQTANFSRNPLLASSYIGIALALVGLVLGACWWQGRKSLRSKETKEIQNGIA